MKTKLRLLILRHGATKGNAEKRYIGRRSQEPLSPDGRQFLIDNARNYPNAISLFVSPALRCQTTAKIVYPRLYPKRITIDELNEMDFGVFEGKNYRDLENDADYRYWVDGGCTGIIPGGENRADFIARTITGFGKVISTLEKQYVDMNSIFISDSRKFTVADRGQEMMDAVIIAHGGTIMAVLSSFSDEDYFSFEAAPGEGYTFTVNVGSDRS